MTAQPRRPFDSSRFALLDDIARRLGRHRTADGLTGAAVDVLTADADPDRAARLAIRPGEPSPVVERLAAWALARASDDAVTRAHRILTDGAVPAHAGRFTTVA